MDGVDYGQPLDQYAPDALKPALVRWRKWIAEHPSGPETDTVTEPLPSPDSADNPAVASQSSAWSAAPWDDHATFVDLPKNLIASIGIYGLTLDEGVSAEAAVVCQLTNLEADAVKSLYAGMKSRFIKMESEHFVRHETDRDKFVLRAFPTETVGLQKEWNGKLKELLGESRGELLDQLIRTPPSTPTLAHQRMLAELRSNPTVDWLHSGTDDIDVEIIRTNDNGGNRGPSVRYHSPREGGISGSFGPVTGDRVPARFRHLLTPELMKRFD